MKINWKILGNSPGYRAQKLAYIKELKDEARHRGNKDHIHRRFQWIINRAKHYEHHTEGTLDYILFQWEKNRTYSWSNYYQDHSFPRKYDKRTIKPVGKRGLKALLKRRYSYGHPDRASMNYRIRLIRASKEGTTRKGHKARWSMDHKRRHARLKSYRQTERVR